MLPGEVAFSVLLCALLLLSESQDGYATDDGEADPQVR